MRSFLLLVAYTLGHRLISAKAIAEMSANGTKMFHCRLNSGTNEPLITRCSARDQEIVDCLRQYL